jgi:hypothetical protein
MSALCLPYAFSMTRAFDGPKSKVQCVKALLPLRTSYEWVGPAPLKPTMNLLAAHQYRVKTLPEGAALLARSDRSR